MKKGAIQTRKELAEEKRLADLSKRLAERLPPLRFDPARNLPRPEERLTILGRPVASPGNLQTIIATAKSGKSAYVGAALAAIMAADRESRCDALGWSAAPPKGRRVIHVDTEQSRFDHDELIRRAMRRANVQECPAWLDSYCLTGFAEADILDAIRLRVAEARTGAGVYAIIIDGVADLVADVNSLEQTSCLVRSLHALAIEADCPILCVIHENEGKAATGDARGHLGKQLMRKSESNLRLKQKDGVTTVSSEKMRRAPILEKDGPRFAWSDLHRMHVSKEAASAEKNRQARDDRSAKAKAAFRHLRKKALAWSELHAALVELEHLSERGAQDRIKSWTEEGVVGRDSAGRYVLAE